MSKILHVTTVPQSLGFIKGLIGYLRDKGHNVEVLSSPGQILLHFCQSMQVKAHTVDMPRKITPFLDIKVLFKIWRLLRRERPSLVHAHTPKGGLLGITGAWLARVPIRIYHIHGLPLVTAVGLRRHLLRWSEKVSCRLATEVLCVSHSIRDVSIRERLSPPDKIKVLLRGSIGGIDATGTFDPHRYNCDVQQRLRTTLGIPLNVPVLGYVGRIVRDKGIVELTEAWTQLREEFPDLHLLMAGPFESQDPIPHAVEQQIKADPRVHLAGFITENLAPYYAVMTLCVLPTYREGFPTVPLEAAAMRIPTVATQIPGCVDAVVDGVTGTLVPPRDVPALVAAIRRYLHDADLRHQHGISARERVLRDFRPEDIWEATYQEYLNLLERHSIAVYG